MSSKTANDLGNHIQKPNEIDTDDSNQNYCFAHLCYEITYIDLLVADFREMLCHFYILVQTDKGLSYLKRYYMTL